MKWCCLLFFYLVQGWQTVSAQKAGKTSPALVLEVRAMVGGNTFSFDSSYRNASGESFQVTRCLFYLSNFSVTYTDGNKNHLPPSYFLINLSDSSTWSIRIPVDNKKILSIHFLIGIDSSKNVGGIQRGVLDPARGMFWTWNTGYVMAKLEGTSSSSKLAGQKFSYHIGGYAGNQNVVKDVMLVVPKQLNQQKPLTLLADLLHWFNGSAPLSIAKHPSCHSPGKLALQIANNYQSMFTLQQQP
jgi:hypothetical protein